LTLLTKKLSGQKTIKKRRHKIDPDTGYTKRQQKAQWKKLFGQNK